MFSLRRPLLVLTVALLSLASCQDTDTNCYCTENRNRSISVELNCHRDTESILEVACDRAEVPAVPAGYSLIASYGVYKLYRTVMVWDSASSFCELEGGRLAIPQDNVSFTGIVELLEAAPGVTIAYLGINDVDETGVYMGVDGNAAPYLTWRENEPDHAVNADGEVEHCVEFSAAGMNDIHCNDQAAFVCEIPGVVDGYTWVETAGRFVSLHSDEVTYEEAQAACEDEGATLAVLETWDAAIAVLDALYDDLVDVVDCWVGFDDINDEGTFLTATGRKLEDMEFINWDKNQPSANEGDDCMTMSYLGYYDDISCTNTSAYLCQVTRW